VFRPTLRSYERLIWRQGKPVAESGRDPHGISVSCRVSRESVAPFWLTRSRLAVPRLPGLPNALPAALSVFTMSRSSRRLPFPPRLLSRHSPPRREKAHSDSHRLCLRSLLSQATRSLRTWRSAAALLSIPPLFSACSRASCSRHSCVESRELPLPAQVHP
jgi:hypothetical protein